MNPAAPLRNLPLRSQLMLAFSLLAVATTAICTITLTTLATRRMHAGLEVKSAHYARQVQQQLQSILEPDSRLTARELFASLAGDGDVDGLGVYLSDGEPIEGRGNRPVWLGPDGTAQSTDATRIVAIAPIALRDRLAGRLYVGLTTAPIDLQRRRDLWIAAGVAAGVVSAALGLAVMMSRRISRRLVGIAAAAHRMAAGERTPTSLDESGQDEIGHLARAFNVMVSELNRLSADHARLVATERERLEALVWERTAALQHSREMFRLIAESTHATPFTLDLNAGSFPYIGQQAIDRGGIAPERWQLPGALDLLAPRTANPELRRRLDDCGAGRFEFEATLTLLHGQRAEMRFAGTCEIANGATMLRGLFQDVTELRRLERELAAAQKLESVGRLAAGVAHEINTPLQFITDNVQFVRTSLDELKAVLAAYEGLKAAVNGRGDVAAAVGAVRAAEQSADLGYLLENTPPAIADALGGLQRITTIVRSMKEFAHPDQARKTFADLNRAIRSTLVVAHNEYKYVAELEADLGDLPPVQCHLGEINQVILNLIVNAAHSIEDVVRDSGALGKITVRTRALGAEVEISIADTGAGIPVPVRDRIFDPFFTTKELGRGSGQGLAFARSIIVNKHSGSLRFETEIGRGTTFFVRLPRSHAAEAADPAAAA